MNEKEPGWSDEGERDEPGGADTRERGTAVSLSSVIERVSESGDEWERESTPSESLLMTGGKLAEKREREKERECVRECVCVCVCVCVIVWVCVVCMKERYLWVDF